MRPRSANGIAAVSWSQLGFEIAAVFPIMQSCHIATLPNYVDLILPDIRMPIMDGLGAFRKLLEKGTYCTWSSSSGQT